MSTAELDDLFKKHAKEAVTYQQLEWTIDCLIDAMARTKKDTDARIEALTGLLITERDRGDALEKRLATLDTLAKRLRLDCAYDIASRSLGVTLRLDGQPVAGDIAQLDGMMCDRGVFRPEATYRAGDTVSRDGSFWVAQEAMQGIVPGKGVTSWRLAVKHGERGRPGRDATSERP